MPRFLYNQKTVQFLLQGLILLGLAFMIWGVGSNLAENIEAKGLQFGLSFLFEKTGFGISQTLISYSEESTFAQLYLVGLLNTLLVAVVGIILATVLGLVIALARLSANPVLRAWAHSYIEITRNLPALFQILFCYVVLLNVLPKTNLTFFFDSVILNVRGLYLPVITVGYHSVYIILTIIIASLLTFWFSSYLKAYRERTGRNASYRYVVYALLPVAVLCVWAFQGFTFSFAPPEAGRFNVTGGLRIIPEFIALTLALSIYTAGFIAEIIRAGLSSVSKGQTEAAQALGFNQNLIYRFILIPQALRLIIPPLTSQYLNITKNSSLAIAVGYPDLTAVFAGTALNQTGHTIEIILITLLTYLSLSLITSVAMNIYNERIKLVGRT